MEENNMDTPQNESPQQIPGGTTPDAFAEPVNDGSNDNTMSVEDAFFGNTESNNQSAPQEGQPAENQETTIAEQPYEAKNDDKRYEYWQSQAAKKDNELKTLQNQVKQAIQQGRPQMPQVQAAPVQEFPPPPHKPEKPRGFSREEAWSDSSSESARYLDDMEHWQGEMSEYRDLRHQYELALVRERMDAADAKEQQMIQRQRKIQQTNQQTKQVYDHLRGHYGLSDEEGREFIQTMSNPDSISMENLVQLYRMNKGASPVNTQSQGPSETFQQSRNAQQVPSPMGVMPAQSAQSNRSESDTIMDDIITDFKDRNPWGN